MCADMRGLVEAFTDALALLLAGDEALWEVVWLTLRVTGAALFIATLIGIPLGATLGLSRRVPLRGLLIPLIYTGMGLPPVVVGLFVYLFLSREGPLGELGWLFSPTGMIVAQTILALPLVVGLTMAAVEGTDPALPTQLEALGATRRQVAVTTLLEVRGGVSAAIVAAFGAIISEVGAVMLVGGNIAGETRVLTTAIVLETRKGNFALALALGVVLLLLAFGANFTFYRLEGRGRSA